MAPDPEPASEAETDPVIDDEAISEVRASVNSWWCPEDDTSMPHDMTTCPTCGFIRP